MPDNLAKSIEVGPRYVRHYRYGRVEIATAPATENPHELDPAEYLEGTSLEGEA